MPEHTTVFSDELTELVRYEVRYAVDDLFDGVRGEVAREMAEYVDDLFDGVRGEVARIEENLDGKLEAMNGHNVRQIASEQVVEHMHDTLVAVGRALAKALAGSESLKGVRAEVEYLARQILSILEK